MCPGGPKIVYCSLNLLAGAIAKIRCLQTDAGIDASTTLTATNTASTATNAAPNVASQGGTLLHLQTLTLT